MLRTLLTLIFSLALIQSGINSEKITGAKNTTEIEKKVVQTVKVDKEQFIKPKEKVQPVNVSKEKQEKWIQMEVTAYSNHFASTGKHEGDKDYGVTYSGTHTKEGRTIAADLSKYPVGTIVYIEDVGERIVEDKGGDIKEEKLDLYFESEQDAKNYGRKKNVKVKIIKMGVKKD